MKMTTEELLKTLMAKRTIEELFDNDEIDFDAPELETYLELLLKEKSIKKSVVIRKSNLDKNYAYQLFNGTKKNPSRNKIIMLAFGFGLNYDETRKLIRCAGVGELYPRTLRDGVIIYCLEKKQSLITCNEYLSDFSLEIIE